MAHGELRTSGRHPEGAKRPKDLAPAWRSQILRSLRSLRMTMSLRVPIDAPLELRVDALLVGDREVDVVPVRRGALEVDAAREDVLLRPAVLADEAPQVAEALAAGERPERLLTEVERDRRVLRGRRRQRRHGRRLEG